MFDITLRPIKDNLFDPLSQSVPSFISPLHLTLIAFICGLQCCLCAYFSYTWTSLLFWVLNRVFDCLDGSVARYRGTQSDLGGFLDLLGDFVVYSLIPITIATGNHNSVSHEQDLLVVSLLEASFHVNNFVLFYTAALIEKLKKTNEKTSKELTSLAMRPALIEGVESSLFFTSMLLLPAKLSLLSIVMFFGVIIGTTQRVYWIWTVLGTKGSKSIKL